MRSMEEIIVKDFGSQVANGMAVFDSKGDKIGTVQQYDITNGWFQTEKGLFFTRDRYIPFSAIDHISPTGMYLSVTKDYAKDNYDQPPFVDVDVEPGPGGATAVGTVPSGYNGRRVVVNSRTISEVLDRLENGLKVFDSNGDKVGRVYQYVPGSEWIVVEKGAFSSDLYVPVTAINFLDGEGVHLRVTKDVLKDAFVLRPYDVAAGKAGAVAVGTVSSRTDDSVVVDSMTISLAMDRMGTGPKVFDAKGEKIGRVYQYDPSTGWIVVEKGTFFPEDLFIPVTAVKYLDNEGAHLRVGKDVLKDAFVVKPGNASFVPTAQKSKDNGKMATPKSTRTDADITADVLAELAWDPAVTLADLDVDTSNGYVTLAGTAATFGIKYAAELGAYRIAGVRDVTNDITVNPSALGLRSDDAIRTDVLAALTLDTTVPLDRVGVAVDKGIVTLTGSLDYFYQRQAARDDAMQIAGVIDVVDLIIVQYPGMVAADVESGIAQAFARNAELADDDVTVTVDNGTVTLGGTVRTWSEYDEAEAAAWRAPGISQVVNSILVTY